MRFKVMSYPDICEIDFETDTAENPIVQAVRQMSQSYGLSDETYRVTTEQGNELGTFQFVAINNAGEIIDV